MTTIDFTGPVSIEEAGGEIEFVPPDLIRASGPGGRHETHIPGLQGSSSLELWCDGQRCLVIGWKDENIVVVTPAAGTVETLGRLSRLDLSGKYDPGGLERIRIIGLDDGTVLIEHELGIARVSPTDGIAWEQVHGDLTARVVGVDAEAVSLRSETGEFGYKLGDGRLMA